MKITKKIFGLICIFLIILGFVKVFGVYTTSGDKDVVEFSNQAAKNMIKDYNATNYRGLGITSNDDRMYFSRTMCIHPHAGQIKSKSYTYEGTDIIKINENNNEPTKARCLDTTTFIESKENSKLAFLAYYGTVLDVNKNSGSLSYRWPSDTGWTFRSYYRDFLKQFSSCGNVPKYWNGTTEWVNETETAGKYGSISDLKYYHKDEKTGNNVYAYCDAYADFIESLNNEYDIKNEKSNTEAQIVEIGGKTCIGPLKFSKPVASTIVKNLESIKSTTNSSTELGKLLELTNSVTCTGATFDNSFINADGTTVDLADYNNDYEIYAVIKDIQSNINQVSITISNQYNMYKAGVFLMATSGQENASLAGEQIKHNSNITYTADVQPDITVSKTVYEVNSTKVDADTANVEVGDTVVFKIDITNVGGSTSQDFTLTDEFNSSLKYSAENSGWTKDTNTKYKQTISGIDKGETITKYIKFIVGGYDSDNKITDGSTGITLKNTAEISGLPSNNKGGTTLSNDASVYTLKYNYSITKTIAKIYDSNMNDTNQTQVAEKGDIIQYRIVFENKSRQINDLNGSTDPIDVWVKDIVIKDVLPAGVTLKSGSCKAEIQGTKTTINHPGYWEYNNCNAWDMNYTDSDRTLTINLKSGRSKCSETKTFYILAEVTEPLRTGNFNMTNTAEVTSITNRNGIQLGTSNSTIGVNVLGYNASINKYILSGTRNTMTNAERSNAPVVVKKGDTITYRIEMKNEGNSILYAPKIVDVLPAGLEYISNSSGWTKNGNTYIYNGNLAAKDFEGDSATLDIQCKVTISNMYLYNIENSVTYGIINNHNNINVTPILPIGDKYADYIRLDDLTIEGTVWEDTNKDGIRNVNSRGEYTENAIPEIDVMLHHITNEGDTVVATTKTGSNGKYSFGRVQKGTDFVVTNNETKDGYYPESSTYKEYYIEFKYNGVTYISTEEYKNQTNLTGNGSFNDNYREDSNAAETTTERDRFNSSLETISYNKAHGNGTTKDLYYKKDGQTSTLNLTSATTMSSYSFVNTESGVKDTLWLYTANDSGTGYLKYINLGLVKRETADLELQTGIESFEQTINGQEMLYKRGEIQKAYTLRLYEQDYSYRYTDYEDEDIRNMKTDLSELNIEVKYKTVITNESESINVKVNELTQYYNKNFKPVYKTDGTLNTQKMKIDSDNNGIFDDTDKVYSFKVECNGSEDTVTASRTSTYADYTGGGTSNYNAIYITGIDQELEPGESITIYTNYLVDKEDISRKLKIDGKLDVISEINAYSTYKDSKPAGVIDEDSNPGNLGISPSIDLLDETCYEDDTYRTGITFEHGSDEKRERRITGVVWKDRKNGDIVDGEQLGNGILDGPEDEEEYKEQYKIGNVKVDLYEIVKVNGEYKEVSVTSSEDFRTNENGEYTITGYIPGMYVVRFTYGDKTSEKIYTGENYRSTIYTLNAENAGQNITNDNLKLLTRAKISDARDDENRRLEVMKYSVEMYNDIVEKLKNNITPEKTYMYADTPTFIVRMENVENNVSSIKWHKQDDCWYKNGIKEEINKYVRSYKIENIDFGLIERPKSKIDLNKYISEIKLTTSSGDVLINAKYEFNDKGEFILDTENSKGTENLQALDNTETQQGFRYLNVDEELLQGATIQIKYGFKVINNSEVDHISSNLYGNETELTTAQINDKINVAKGLSTLNNKYTNSSDYYGQYLGGVYYKGELDINDPEDSNDSYDKPATIKVDMLLDYVDNELSFNPAENEGKWGTILSEELLNEDKRYLNSGVLNEEGKLADIDGIEYQTENKNNLAVTIYDNGNDFSKLLLPKKYLLPEETYDLNNMTDEELEDYNQKLEKSTTKTELTVSTFLSPENDSENQMVYENIAEIIKFTTLTGRRTVGTQTVGNAKIHMAGYTNSDDTLDEPDTSITEKVLLTPPTGLGSLDMTIRLIAYIVSGMIIIILGILYIPKLVDKIKNRKFIK